jgi:protocatechuate 4,5-dioxygenase alpha chain
MIIFDGEQAIKGYGLNKMCFSFNSGENREAFLRDEGAYCDKFNLSPEQRAAVQDRNILELLQTGGNIYYLAKWAGIYGMTARQVGALQGDMSEKRSNKCSSELKDVSNG